MRTNIVRRSIEKMFRRPKASEGRRKSGVTAIEYALVAAAIAVVLTASNGVFGSNNNSTGFKGALNSAFTKVTSAINN